MSVKEDVLRMIQSMPEHVTMNEIIDELNVRAKIEEGLKNLDEGKFIAHDEVRRRLNKWLTN